MTLHAQLRVDHPDFMVELTLDVAAGEVVAVLGPNGAGKTTLLRALAGLHPLTTGRIELDGDVLEDVTAQRRVPPQDRRVGVVFQDYRLFPHLSVRDNVAFGPRSAGRSRTLARKLAADWLELLGLAALADNKPSELSGGQAQKVALARALCTEPALLLLDEPLSALDVAARTEVRAQLHAVLAAFAGAVLLVTHDPLEALSLADRLVIVENGRVTQDASPHDIVRRPATRYIATLVGLNLFRGIAHDGTLDLSGGGQLIVADATLEGPALAVVRPSSLMLHRHQPIDSSARNVFPGRLAGLEAWGDRVRVYLEGAPSVIADITTAAVADLRLAPGDELWISLKATDLECYSDTEGDIEGDIKGDIKGDIEGSAS